MKKNIIYSLIFFILLLPISAQSDEDQKVFKLAMTSSDIQFNPLLTYTTTEAQLYTAIHEGLVQYHPENLKPIAALASSWDISDDGKVYQFTIRPNAKYSNGELVLAQHFVDAWRFMLENADSVPFAFLLGSY
jgi:oligopeptide transport system substrate-binding protein